MEVIKDMRGHWESTTPFRRKLRLCTCSRQRLTLFPNPAKNGRFQALLTPGWTASARFRVLDMLGREVAEREFPDAAGSHLLALQFDSLGEGLYTVVVESGGKKWIVKMVVN